MAWKTSKGSYHMVNEAAEFEQFLNMPPSSADSFWWAIDMVGLHKIRLADASGHANTIISYLTALNPFQQKKPPNLQKPLLAYS